MLGASNGAAARAGPAVSHAAVGGDLGVFYGSGPGQHNSKARKTPVTRLGGSERRLRAEGGPSTPSLDRLGCQSSLPPRTAPRRPGRRSPLVADAETGDQYAAYCWPTSRHWPAGTAPEPISSGSSKNRITCSRVRG